MVKLFNGVNNFRTKNFNNKKSQKMKSSSKVISLRQFKDIVNSRTKGVLLFVLTPEIAEYLLGRNTENRQVNKPTLERYIRDIKSGWKHNGDTIKVSIEVVLLDGQHRCLAVIETGVSIEAALSYGLESEVFDTIDTIPNWHDSRGANVEFFIAEILGLKKIIPLEYNPTGQDTLTEETIIYNFETKEEDVIVDFKDGRSSISKKGRAFHVSTHALGGGWKAVRKTGFSNFENKIKNKFSSKNIYLDDLRTPKDLPFCETWEIVRSYDEFISKVNEIGFEKIGIISLDHDLGDSAMAEWQNNVVKNYELEYKNISEKTGYDCAKWIVEQWMQGKPICKVVTHSANAIGSANIMGYINNFKHISGLEQDCIRVKIEFEII
jgi:hypothetical protein